MGRIFIRELRLILSDGGAMLILLLAILIYTTIYSLAYGAEVVQNIDIAVVDEDNTPTSRAIINGLRSGPNTIVKYELQSITEAKELFYAREVYGIVVISDGFERRLLSSNGAIVGLILDGSHLLLYSRVFEQAVTNILTRGAEVEIEYLSDIGADEMTIRSVVEPVKLSRRVLYNPSLGYGSFVMPSIVVVIIQQTLLIGIAMVSLRRRYDEPLSLLGSTKRVVSISLVYVVVYLVNLSIIFLTVWQVFGFPFNGHILSVALFMAIYVFASASFAQMISHLFKRREAPILMLLWSSVPILLLAGVSYPREAFPEWLYAIGRVFPSSSAVDGFIRLNSMGASLYDVRIEIITLLILALSYTVFAIILEKHASVYKINSQK